MPIYDITSPSGQTISVEGNRAPTIDEAKEIFDSIAVSQRQEPMELASLREPTYDEMRAQIEADVQKSFIEDAGDFMQGFGKGILQMARTGVRGIEEGAEALFTGDFERLSKSGVEGVARAIYDLGELGEAIGGSTADLFYSDEEALDRKTRRALQDIQDAKKRQEGLIFSQEETLPNLTELSSIIGDPTNLIGVGVAGKLGKAAAIGSKAQKAANILNVPSDLVRKGVKRGIQAGARGASNILKFSDKPLRVVSKVGRGAEKLIGLPRSTVTNLLGKSLGVGEKEMGKLHRITQGGTLFSPAGAVTAAELTAGGIGKTANIAQDAKTILSILGDTNRKARFLTAAATDPRVPRNIQRAIAVAGTGGEKALDIAFNSLANGVSTATLQSLLTAAAGGDAEAIGQAAGGGALFGGAIPIGRVSDLSPDAPSAMTPMGAKPIPSKRIDPNVTRVTPPGAPSQSTIAPKPISNIGVRRETPQGLTLEGSTFTPTVQKPFATFKQQKPTRKKTVDINIDDKSMQQAFMRKAENEQAISVSKLPSQDKALFALLTKNGVTSDIRVLPKDAYEMTHLADYGQKSGGKPFFMDESGTIWVNEESKVAGGAILEEITNRIGADYISQNPEVIKSVAKEYESKAGKEFPLDSSDPGSERISIGGDLRVEVAEYNANAPAGMQITDLKGAIERFSQSKVDSLFNETNTSLMKSIKDKPATKALLDNVSTSALSKVGMTDRDGDVVPNRNLPGVSSGLKKNKAINRAVSNLDRVKKSIESDRIREEKAQTREAVKVAKEEQRQVAREQKAQLREEAKGLRETQKANKQQAKSDATLDRKFKSMKERVENRHNTETGKKRFENEKIKAQAALSDLKGLNNEAGFGAGNEGIVAPEALKAFYRDVLRNKKAIEHIEAIENLIATGQRAKINAVRAAARATKKKSEAREKDGTRKPEEAIEDRATLVDPFDIQIATHIGKDGKPNRNRTIATVRAFDDTRLRDIAIKNNMSPGEIDGTVYAIKKHIRDGGKFSDEAMKRIPNYNDYIGAIRQYDFRNIVSIDPLQ